MSDRLRKELTFEGGVNLDIDPHLLKSNEWQLLQNMWPYRNKIIGTRPSLLHEQDILPVPAQYWDSKLFANLPHEDVDYPTDVKYYAQWFRHLTPLKAMFLGSLDKLALICVCTASNKRIITEHFEGEAAQQVILNAGDVILMLLPNDIESGLGASVDIYPTIKAVRLGTTNNLTPSLINFNGDIVAANKGCEYVVRVVKKTALPAPSPTIWPDIDYRFTKINFGATNDNFRADGVIVYKNRFVYWKGNKLWVSDAFQPQLIYANAVDTAYLGVFFDTGLTEDITALGNIYTSALEEAGKSVLAIWTQHGMLIMDGEPATTIASTPEEIWSPCKVNQVSVTAGCVSAASIVKTKFGHIWCGAGSVWFMAKGNLPVEVGLKISPRINAQSFESAGRIFATFDELCYRLVINAPGVGYNPYEALNEMWCLSFMGDAPSAESAAWFGPQVFTNTDNPKVQDVPEAGGSPGLFCCAKLTNINDDKTWYIQPYSTTLGFSGVADTWGTRLGLSSVSSYLGVDITAPFRPVIPVANGYNYGIGDIVQFSSGVTGVEISYAIEHLVVFGGTTVDMETRAVYINENGDLLYAKRPLYAWMEGIDLLPEPYKVQIQAANLTLDNPELIKLIDGYELTFKTLNPVALDSWWWPWEPVSDGGNIVFLETTVNVPVNTQNTLGGAFNEPVLTARRIPSPVDKRYNGLTAQLNLTDADYKIVAAAITGNTTWNKIRISDNGIDWSVFNLFDFDSEGIAKYATLIELVQILKNKVADVIATNLDVNGLSSAGYGLKFADDTTPLYIDLSYSGWEWFGFVPTNLDNGYGVNIISTADAPEQYIFSTGPVPCCTPHEIHIAKLAVRYSIFETRPR